MTTLIPYVVAFFAVSCYALMGPMAKKVSVLLPPFTFIAVSTFILATIAGIIAYFFERKKVAIAFDTIHWQWLLVFSLANLVAYVGYLWAITKMPVAQYEMFGIFVPIVGGLFAWLLLNEPFHMRYLVALAFMAVGIYIAVAPDLKVKS